SDAPGRTLRPGDRGDTNTVTAPTNATIEYVTARRDDDGWSNASARSNDTGTHAMSELAATHRPCPRLMRSVGSNPRSWGPTMIPTATTSHAPTGTAIASARAIASGDCHQTAPDTSG